MTFLCCLSALCACTALLGTACKNSANAVFTVTFETNGGSAVEAQEVKNGEHATKPADPTKSGYTFDNWYADANFVTLFDFEKVTITADWTIYANWNTGSSGGEVTPDPVNPDPVNPDPEPATGVTYTCTGLPDWITNDGCVIFAWVWSPNDAGSWKSCTYGTPATSLTFEVSEELTGFLLARCVGGTTQPSWDVHDDSAGRVYNQTENVDCTAGVHSYACAEWKEYN